MDYLKDYIEVKDRIQTFYELYPNGAIHFDFKGELVMNNETYIWGKAFAYPEREKMAYSTGTAWERVPAKGLGRGAEMMLLETSAVGRSLAMLGIKVSKGIASREEVQRNVNPENDPWQTPPDSPKKAVEGKISQETPVQVSGQGQGLEMSHFGNYRVATEKQINFLHSLCKRIYTDWDKEKLLKYLQFLSKEQEFSKLEFAPYTIVKTQLDNQQQLADNLSAWLNASRLPSSHEQAEMAAADWKTDQF
ncbi:MAG: hypothetical protein KXJ46_02885 [Candidatus Methylopumilus sp.]|nr:hypothetical protein [Candidatus Methylopumilus sp.]